MKVYVVSGLGADYDVLEKLEFNEEIEVVFLHWLIPIKKEPFLHYVKRMADRIDDSEMFYLLGYSLGGIMVQEIDKIKPAKKAVIIASIKSDKEKSKLIRLGQWTKIPQLLPTSFFSGRSLMVYFFVRRVFDPKNPKLFRYFKVRDPYFLKWSIEKITEWKFQKNPKVIQIMGDKDIVFPIKNSNPDYLIRGGSHLLTVTKSKEVSALLKKIFTP